MSVNALQLVVFELSDELVAKSFMSLETAEMYGLRKFPSPHQYHEHVRHLGAGVGSHSLPRLVALAQRDWHIRGQNGCLFARLAALSASRLQWNYLVVEDVATLGCADLGRTIDSYLTSAASQPVEVVSLLLPNVRTAAEAVGAIRLLAEHSAFWLERDEVAAGLRRLHLRFPVGGADAQAWVMAFAPFDFVPNTRRGPYFELVVRVKKKPEKIFHRLNQERGIAHLADVPLAMSERHWEDRWQSTLRRTRMILGKQPDDISAAKATLAVPVALLG